MDDALSSELLEFVTREVGLARDWSFVGWDHAESRVWRIRVARGDVFLKAHRHAQKFRQEHDAYVRWTPLLGATCPRLLAAHAQRPHALLITAVPGEVMEGTLWSTDTERRALEAAGRFLRALHGIEFEDTDPVPAEEAIARRFSSCRARAVGIVPDDVLERASQDFRPEVFETMRRVPCHRDFSPRNWLWSQTAGLNVIDFEHARPDLWLVDVLKLDHGPWIDRPDLEARFWHGYGRSPSQRERQRLTMLQCLQAISTITWGREHADPEFEALGRRLLARLRPVSPNET